MTFVEQFIIRWLMLLTGLWVGIGMVMALVMLVESFKRRHIRPYRFVNTECPACEGTGWTPEQEVCGLCDGESTLIHEIEA